jgi:HD-GYP domain-containing protein (c-di-GMP phosphodiesterase class II)
MQARDDVDNKQLRIFLATIGLALVVLAATILLPGYLGLDDPILVSPAVVFWFVTVAGLLCLGGGVLVYAAGLRDGVAEIAILGAALSVLSLLSTAHGILTPGILYGANGASLATAFLALPASLLVAFGLVLPNTGVGRLILRHSRVWSSVCLGVAVVIVAWVMAFPTRIPTPDSWPSALFWGLLLVTLIGFLALGYRELRLGLIGRNRAALLAAGGFVFLGVTMLGMALTTPFSIGWWVLHLVELATILVVAVGLYVTAAKSRSVTGLIQPIIQGDPIRALEIGLTPTVHEWSQTLEAKDAYTRGHVARVAELAMRVGARAKLRPTQVRYLGLGALMHDIGKIGIPKRILTKPGRLDTEERQVIERHAAIGDAIMRSSPVLAEAAAPVRWHHERFDGAGYPDRLVGHEIPIEARITSVCDAFDAMTTNRAYRAAMPNERAIAILTDGAGSQWCPDAVSLVLAELSENGSPAGEILGSPTERQQEPEHDVLDLAS